MSRYLWQYLIDSKKSIFDKKNRDYTKLMKDFGGTEVLSTDVNDPKYLNGNYKRPSDDEYNIRVDIETGVKVLYLEEGGDDPGYYLFICYFK